MNELSWKYNPNRRIADQIKELENIVHTLKEERKQKRLLQKRQYWHRTKEKISEQRRKETTINQ